MSFEREFRRFPGPDGPLEVAPVPWDTQLFGVDFHELRFAEPEAPWGELAASLGGPLAELTRALPSPHLLVAKVPVAATPVAEVLGAAGFYPVETMVYLHLSLARFQPLVARAPASLALRAATTDDLPELEAMAARAFTTDRFHLDPHLSNEAADRRYVSWLRGGLEAGDPVFVYEDTRRGKRVGFYHVRETGPGVVDLSLAAVRPDAQRIGLGLLMYQAVVAECRERGFREAETHVTVGNLDVLNLFMRLGFEVRRPVFCFHRFA